MLIQKQLGFSGRELVEEITENPYLQYFIGLPGFQTVPPFVPSLLVEFRKRLRMIRHRVHSVPDRIVSISQPNIRPIVRDKAAAPVEFGAKFQRYSITLREQVIIPNVFWQI